MTTTFAAPVNSDDDVELVQGDSYSNTDSRALVWDLTGFPDLTGATVTMMARSRSMLEESGAILSVTGAVVTATGSQRVRAELTVTDTADLISGENQYEYQVVASLSGGGPVTLVRGDMTVLRRQA